MNEGRENIKTGQIMYTGETTLPTAREVYFYEVGSHVLCVHRRGVRSPSSSGAKNVGCQDGLIRTHREKYKLCILLF